MRTPPGPLALLALLLGCAAPARVPEPSENPMDPHSHARPDRVRVVHVVLDLTADFGTQSLRGEAVLTLDRRDPKADLVLDTASTLNVESVRGADGSVRPFLLGDADPVLGSALTVPLMPGDREVTVRYHTRPDAAALQWLAPPQTDGGRRPFLFTQGQAILTRSWIPLQDTPGVRQTYAATIRTPGDADLVAVMSADSREVVEPGLTRFSMSRPIPSYLIALAIGDLARRDVSPRCAIWAEPGVVEDAASELEDVDAMLAACELLYGPYQWGRYDVLILPPSFPFGGMENPCLTFATPTILAGDKSLVSLIAHELAHSWSGNLVTNATWNDFWLNEGFTVYVEQRIVEALYGSDRMKAETAIGIQGLEREVAELPPDDQRLAIDLGGRDPDDGMTAIPYDKGAAFLRRLEHVFGRERFDAFLRAWFDEHAFESATTAEFVGFLERRLLARDPVRAAEVDVRTWVFGTGLPDDLPRPRVDTFEILDARRHAWLGSGSTAELGADAWSTMEWLHFLNGIPDDADPARLGALDAEFGLTRSGNSEILAAWLERNVRLGYGSMPDAVDARLESFLMEVGRRKFLEPLYKALNRTPDGARRAREIYGRARQRYHAISSRTIDEILGWGD